MRIAVLGSGAVGRTLAAGLSARGHDVTMGTRDPEATRARTERGQDGASEAEWLAAHPEVPLAAFAEAARDAELVVNASSGTHTLDVLDAVGADHLAGKPLLDVANPLDFSAGFPPTLTVKDTDSLAEQVQRAHPEAHVVKALNTVTAAIMVDPGLLAEPGTVFVAGDDEGAKATVTALLADLGHTDVLDLGDLSAARGAEMLLPLWLRCMQAVGTPIFGFKVVRAR